ncbi:hypothetical protein [Acinetobacter terrae]|uniref:Uncharacterized protein n=1 Tax=Acinetobacter terrae TaxID=2731247 RepID=A0A4R0ERE2_9GAMM|nr:hypothetical protein [Acinetobacter terrae]TCB62237.1 hypothetical protein E0H85_01570 [Acinetobacter terrae]
MDIKNTAISAKVVIQSLIEVLGNEGIDAHSIKFKIGSDEEGYGSEDLDFGKLIDLTLKELEEVKAQTVPEGFVEKTESNTHHYFKLKDWDEWTCIDGIKDAITSDHDINAIVEVECLEVIEVNNKPCFALLAFGKRHGTEVKFFDTEEEAIEAQEPAND